MSTSISPVLPTPVPVGRGSRVFTILALLLVALAVLLLSSSAFAQVSTLTTTGIDSAVCTILKVVKKFAFYALIVTIILIGIAIKMDESKGLVTRAVQILVGVWVIINAVAIADLVSGGALGAMAGCTGP